MVDSQKTALTNYVYAATFKNDDLQVFGSVSDNSDLNVSVYQTLDKMKLGLKVGYKTDTKNTNFGAALSYKPNPTSKVITKIDHNCVVGMAYKLKLSPSR